MKENTLIVKLLVCFHVKLKAKTVNIMMMIRNIPKKVEINSLVFAKRCCGYRFAIMYAGTKNNKE